MFHLSHRQAAVVTSLILFAATAFSNVAHATLIAVDLFVSGDQLVTRDTTTGLDWLDLTATMNLSAQDIQNGVGGWKGLGFSHASTDQVRTLFIHADPDNVVINTGANPTSPANLPGAQLLLGLVGVTHPGPSANDFDVLGNGIAGLGEPGAGLVHFADYGTNTDATFGFFFVPDGTAPLAFSHVQVGNFLIRISAVPEPSVLWMLLAGLAGILGWQRSKPNPSFQRTACGCR